MLAVFGLSIFRCWNLLELKSKEALAVSAEVTINTPVRTRGGNATYTSIDSVLFMLLRFYWFREDNGVVKQIDLNFPVSFVESVFPHQLAAFFFKAKVL